jgi:branched-chain amino acid transport system ATP-binding protein
MSLLEADGVVSGYGQAEILHGVSFQVNNGEIITIIGPNGAGKSTLLKTTYGLVDCWAGDLHFSGTDITDARPNELTQRGMCYVPQRNNIFPTLTVRENLRMGAYIESHDVEEDIERELDRFPILREREHQRAGQMSGGQRQMLALSSALMTAPEVLLVDEPSAGLAPDLIDEMFAHLETIRDDTGVAILMVEQNARKALSISDRGYVLDMGENRISGTGDELIHNEEVRSLYLGG